ncbi:MAG: MlaD family protein [Planctomycetota bacterium]
MSDSQSNLPVALVRERQSVLWLAILPLVAALVAAYMLYASLGEKGLVIRVHTDEGHGLKDGASVRYRGIQVGTVEAMRLSHDLTGVELEVRLDEDARDLAREGTQFWIVYPKVGLDGIQGIETVIGARYLAVAPAPGETLGDPVREFVARGEAPVEDTLLDGGLDLVLDASSKYGLEAGAPITYRGFWIGRVTQVALASDATVVEVHARIAAEYRSLVRSNSVFWEESGIEMDMSLTGGLTFDVGTLRSLLMGAVAMATPTWPGDPVQDGQRFSLAGGPEKEWLQWRPALPIGSGALPRGIRPPEPVLGQVAWRSGRILRTRESNRAWVMPLPGGLLGPADFFDVPEGDRGEGLELRFGDQTAGAFPAVETFGELSFGRDPEGISLPASAPLTRALGDPEDCMVYAGPDVAPQSIAAYRMTASARGWEIGKEMRWDNLWHGAPVVARADGAWIGVLMMKDRQAHVAGLPAFLR